MAWGDPLQCRVGRDNDLVESDLAVLAPKPTELAFLTVADGDEVAWHLPNAVNVAGRSRGLWLEAGLGSSSGKELLDDLGDQSPLLRLGRLADDGTQVEFLFGQPFQGTLGDGTESVWAYVLDDAIL